MTDLWLAATGVANLAATPVYAYVGARLYERRVPSPARLPAAQFSIWWWGLGATGAITGAEGLVAAVGTLQLALGLTMYLVTVLADCVILWGLVGYLLYLYTGRNYLVPLSAFYAVFYVVTLYWILASGPSSISVASGKPIVVYAHVVGGPILAFVLLGLIVPELIAVVLYASLIRRTTDRTLRYRIAFVSAAIGLFFLFGFFAPTGSVWALVTAVVDAVSAVLALIAFFPPSAVQRVLRVRPVDTEDESGEGVQVSV
ncbi:MAG TPA: hypothetical protein VGP88_08165 [Thermoplasmata archaeon]|jgi:hypothetical protein|nr:hypothetical protein [Thermoplasmata archaeon]